MYCLCQEAGFEKPNTENMYILCISMFISLKLPLPEAEFKVVLFVEEQLSKTNDGEWKIFIDLAKCDPRLHSQLLLVKHWLKWKDDSRTNTLSSSF